MSAPDKTLESAARRFDTFVSPYTGIVRSLQYQLHGQGESNLPLIASDVSDPAGIIGRISLPRIEAGGIHADVRQARCAAVGEALERYACFFPPDRQTFGSARSLGSAAVDPRSFGLFADWQYALDGFPFQPFDQDTELSWIEGWSVTDGRRVMLPAQLAISGGNTNDSRETKIGWATSNGAALERSLDGAILGGLLEIVERDGVMLAWHSRLSMPKLNWPSDPQLSETIHARMPDELEFSAMDLSVFTGIPSALGVLRSRPSDPVGFLISAAAAPTIRAAVDKTMRECFQGRPWASSMHNKYTGREFKDDFTDVHSFDDHVAFYFNPDHRPYAAFLDASEELKALDGCPMLAGVDDSARLATAVERLASRGANVYAVDMTTDEIAAAGFHVVKVVIPELLELDVAHGFRQLGSRRIYEAPFEAGLTDAPLALEAINPYPHPFP